MRAASGVAIDWPHSIVDQEAAMERIDGDTANTAYVTIDLSKGSWLVGALLPDRDKPSIFRLSGGDAAGLLSRLERLRHLGANRLVLCFEAGHDGFWLARFLLRHGIVGYSQLPHFGMQRPHRVLIGCGDRLTASLKDRRPTVQQSLFLRMEQLRLPGRTQCVRRSQLPAPYGL